MEADAARFDRHVEAIRRESDHLHRLTPFRSYFRAYYFDFVPRTFRESHQSLHPFVSTSTWNDHAVLARFGELDARPRFYDDGVRNPMFLSIHAATNELIESRGIPLKETTGERRDYDCALLLGSR